MKNTFINAVLDQLDAREDVVVLTGDSGRGVFDPFLDAGHPRVINTGIAEQNAIGMASGLARSGMKVFVYNIIPFLLYRPYEQVRNDIAYAGLPVTLIGIGSGLTYGPGGTSHYAVEDLGVASALPRFEVFSPADGIEAAAAAGHALAAERPVYVRFAKKRDGRLHSEDHVPIGRPQVLREGSGELAIAFHGSIGQEVVTAAEALESEGVEVDVVSVPRVQPLPAAPLLETLASRRLVLTVEEHHAATGLGGRLASLAAEHGVGWALRTKGVPEEPLDQVRTTQGFRRAFGLDAEGIAGTVRELLGHAPARAVS